MKTIKLTTLLCAAAIVSLLLHGCSKDEEQVNDTPATEYLVKINEDGITVDDFKWYLASRSDVGRSGNIEEIAKSRLQELVNTKVLALEAKRRGFDQDPSTKFAIDQMLAHKFLTDQINKPAMERKIPESEVEAFFNANLYKYVRPRQKRLADIFIALPKDAPPAISGLKEQQAKSILAEAIKTDGERFAFSNLILEHSDQHPLYAKGDTGYFDINGQPLGLSADFAEKAFGLQEKGKVFNQLIRADDGFHIVMFVGERPAKKTKLEDVSAEIKQQIRHDEVVLKRENLIQSLNKQASTEVSSERINEIIKKK